MPFLPPNEQRQSTEGTGQQLASERQNTSKSIFNDTKETIPPPFFDLFLDSLGMPALEPFWFLFMQAMMQ